MQDGATLDSSVGPPSGPTCTSIIATTAVIAGGLGALASAAYFHYFYGRHSSSSGLSTGPCTAGPGTTGPLRAGALPDGGDTARHHPSSISGTDATTSHAGGSCSYCGALEGAACALRAPKADPYDPRPREGCVSPELIALNSQLRHQRSSVSDKINN